MEIILRKSNRNDLDNIYNLHLICFSFGDHWYKNAICNYIDNSLVIEYNTEIIGVLLQGYFIPIINNDILDKPLNIKHNDLVYSIVMLCINPNYRNNGLATLLLNEHINQLTQNSYLNVRKSNITAIKRYINVGYIIIGLIKNKYYLPVEDSYIMMFTKVP
uniref:N-acetyltransferase domain-containing protein n=1 Tax=viral metagenome TaxID=1070528 RepID=A0A6C0H8C7_9ZZZZ